MLNSVMAMNPWLEVAIRTAYWRLPAVRSALSRLTRGGGSAPAEKVPGALQAIIATLAEAGVGRGDILIVHSDLDLLHKIGARPAEVNAALAELVGPEGTLVMPAYPLFADEPKGVERMTADVSTLTLRYDPKRTPIWTGLLPHALMRSPGARRSALPINSLVALGAHADRMFATELDGELIYPCGRQSAWFYCYERNAKIVGLGIDLPHSLTMNHVAEDSFPDNWTRLGWYRKRRFEIVRPDGSLVEKMVAERLPRWAMNYAERRLAADLRRAGVLREYQASGISLEMVEGRAHIDFLRKRADSHYPYYFLPFQKQRAAARAPRK